MGQGAAGKGQGGLKLSLGLPLLGLSRAGRCCRPHRRTPESFVLVPQYKGQHMGLGAVLR